MTHDLRDLCRWTAAGMSDGQMLTSGTLETTAWWAPAVTLAGDRIHWALTGEGAHEVRPSKEMLDRFVRLVDAPPARVLAFARRWGTLTVDRASYLEPGAALSGDESLERWQATAREARALLRIGSKLLLSEPVDPTWWSELTLVCRAEVRTGSDTEVVRVQDIEVPYMGPPEMAFARVLSVWLQWSGVEPVVSWQSRPALELSPGGLLGAIALQLAYVCSRQGGLSVCSNCETPFQSPRHPRPGFRSYCESCRKTGAPQRDAKRDWRRREREREMAGAPQSKEG